MLLLQHVCIHSYTLNLLPLLVVQGGKNKIQKANAVQELKVQRLMSHSADILLLPWHWLVRLFLLLPEAAYRIANHLLALGTSSSESASGRNPSSVGTVKQCCPLAAHRKDPSLWLRFQCSIEAV